MDQLKKPKPDASKRLKDMYQKIRDRPFSQELIELLKKGPTKVENEKARKEN